MKNIIKKLAREILKKAFVDLRPINKFSPVVLEMLYIASTTNKNFERIYPKGLLVDRQKVRKAVEKALSTNSVNKDAILDVISYANKTSPMIVNKMARSSYRFLENIREKLVILELEDGTAADLFKNDIDKFIRTTKHYLHQKGVSGDKDGVTIEIEGDTGGDITYTLTLEDNGNFKLGWGWGFDIGPDDPESFAKGISDDGDGETTINNEEARDFFGGLSDDMYEAKDDMEKAIERAEEHASGEDAPERDDD